MLFCEAAVNLYQLTFFSAKNGLRTKMGQVLRKKSSENALEGEVAFSKTISRDGCDESTFNETYRVEEEPSRRTKCGFFARLRPPFSHSVKDEEEKNYGSSDESMESVSDDPEGHCSKLSMDNSKECDSASIPTSPYKVLEGNDKSLKAVDEQKQGGHPSTEAGGIIYGGKDKGLTEVPLIRGSNPICEDLKIQEYEESTPCTDESTLTKRNVEERLRKLETPQKWLTELIGKGKHAANADHAREFKDAAEGKRNKWKQDHFRVATYHLFLSATHCLDDCDNQKALKDLSLSRSAQMRFSDILKNREYADEFSAEARRGDEDVAKALVVVIDSSMADISFKRGKLNDTKHFLENLRKQIVTPGITAAIKGIKASVIACMDSQVVTAIEVACEAMRMDPNYWRWHSLFAILLQRLPEPEDPSVGKARRKEMFEALETSCLLEPRVSRRALLLADTYRNMAFQVRRRKESDEDYRDYARKSVAAYMVAVDRAPKCAQTHVRAARSLWNLKRLCREASQRAIVVAERALQVLTEGDDAEEIAERTEAEMESMGEASLMLGLVWESIGNLDRAVILFRMAITNPFVSNHVAYRAELGIIVASFHKGKFHGKEDEGGRKFDVLDQLDKLIVRFSDGDLQQQTLCHKGYYLMTVRKDMSAALDSFCKASRIKPESGFLKRYYPRFSLNNVYPVRISDLIHEAACKELALVQVRAMKGSPEAVRRASFLNELLFQEMNSSLNLEAGELSGSKNESCSTEKAELQEDTSPVSGSSSVENQVECDEEDKVDPMVAEEKQSKTEDEGSKASNCMGNTNDTTPEVDEGGGGDACCVATVDLLTV